MSARSMLRPRTRNCHVRSRLVPDSTSPETIAARSRIQEKKSWGAKASRCAVSWFQVVLRHSHSSVETISRARRAFSRAAASAPAMAPGDVTS
jgi:hypothetical protein